LATELSNVFCRHCTTETYVVETADDLQKVLEAPHKGLVFVESVMDNDDSPVDLIRGGHAFADTDYGPRGSQFVPGEQLEIPNR
jgi:indolepyruvate decarboxylase